MTEEELEAIKYFFNIKKIYKYLIIFIFFLKFNIYKNI